MKRDINYTIAIKWGVEDVLMIAEDMEVKVSVEEACDILDMMDRQHDAEYGICWETIRSHVQFLVADREKEKV